MDYLDLDLEDTRLDTTFPAPGEIRHISYHSDPDVGRRMIEDEEIWRTKETLGEGGFGTVWLQERISHNGPKKPSFRAVKMLDKSGKSANMYKKELMAMAKFSKPLYRRCFIECYGWYLQAENVCIAMEYARHQDLQKHLAKSFTESEAGLIASQIAEGLKFMHDNKYAHRDLKPANIMVMYPGPDWWVKIGDFGITKRAVEGVTSLHTKVFTPEYAAPELRGLGVSRTVANGTKDEITYTFAIDMWSFGEICVRLLTKAAAFPELMQLVNYKLYGIFLPDDILYQNGLGSDCRSFIRKAMDMNPENRFTAEEAQRHPWITKFRKAPFSRDVKSSTPPSGGMASMDDITEEITAYLQSQSEGTADWDTIQPPQATAISSDKSETSQASNTRSHHFASTDRLTEKKGPVAPGNPAPGNAAVRATILGPSFLSLKDNHESKPREANDQNVPIQVAKSPHSATDKKPPAPLSQDIEPGDYLFVLFNFTARSDDELTIKKGQIITLIETDHIYKDEWWLGEEVHTKNRGIFPARYTRKARAHEEQMNGIRINTPLQSDTSAYGLPHNGAVRVERDSPLTGVNPTLLGDDSNASSTGGGADSPYLSVAQATYPPWRFNHEKPPASVAKGTESSSAGDGPDKRHSSVGPDHSNKPQSEDRNSQSRTRKVFGYFR
ncbi:kinase-like domain-containing protein [Penicillium frequentans]|uniref:Serine/threonine-protein kinase ATG1 n=1 Tax=Penicillium frequentans TaxID=3151616 RepID=A0AAD6CL13_9EURO|nr:kinase-like domain-containing protein [Penicillium glabrum]